MEDKLVMCNHCGSAICYSITKGSVTIYSCPTCGFHTNSLLFKDSEFYKAQFEVLPEIYKHISYEDTNGLIWIPQYVKQENKGLVYMEGKSVEDCEWVGVKEVKIPEEERKNYPKPSNKKEFYEYKTDMSTLKRFGKLGFLEAINYIQS